MKNTGTTTLHRNNFFLMLLYRKDREKKAVLAGVSFNSVSRIDSCARQAVVDMKYQSLICFFQITVSSLIHDV